MIPSDILIVIAGVMVGNLLTVMFGYFVWQARKAEKEGRNPLDQNWDTIICGLLPPVIGVCAALYMRSLL